MHFVQDERSHRTIQTKTRFDLLENIHLSGKQNCTYDWVLALPLYQTIYNSGYHRALGTIMIM